MSPLWQKNDASHGAVVYLGSLSVLSHTTWKGGFWLALHVGESFRVDNLQRSLVAVDGESVMCTSGSRRAFKPRLHY